MSDLRKSKMMVKCPRCNGYKGIYGKSQMGYPATLPCPRCPNSSGEVDFNTMTEEEKAK